MTWLGPQLVEQANWSGSSEVSWKTNLVFWGPKLDWDKAWYFAAGLSRVQFIYPTPYLEQYMGQVRAQNNAKQLATCIQTKLVEKYHIATFSGDSGDAWILICYIYIYSLTFKEHTCVCGIVWCVQVLSGMGAECTNACAAGWPSSFWANAGCLHEGLIDILCVSFSLDLNFNIWITISFLGGRWRYPFACWDWSRGWGGWSCLESSACMWSNHTSTVKSFASWEASPEEKLSHEPAMEVRVGFGTWN